MWVTIAIQALQALAGLVSQIAPLIAQGKADLSLTDATAIHNALLQAEAATAALRPQVDAALDAATAKG